MFQARAIWAAAAVFCAPAAFAGSCEFTKLGEFPVTMSHLRPWATARVNDTDAYFLVDSGAFYSMLSGAQAAQLGLSTYHSRHGELLIGGVLGGQASSSIARVSRFSLANVALHDIEFIVSDSSGLGTVGLLGQNILHIGDVEYDLGHGMVRLMRVKDCDKVLAYWVATGDAFSIMDIEKTSPVKPWTVGMAAVNGAPIRVLFDTGAGVSVLSLKAAASVGVTPDSPGVESGGPISGLGGGSVASHIARFSTFKIGDEEIRNPKLRIAAITLPNADMLIGPDFFQSHRVYVANSQRKLYFTYNGGPVFNVSQLDSSSSELDASPPTPDAGAAHAPEQAIADAPEYARRALGLASRNDFSGALVALGHAIELDPGNPEYFYQRANVWLQLSTPSSALADFDQAVKLRPDYVAALLARSALYFRKGDKPNGIADLDTAGRSLTKEADARLGIAEAYRRAGDLNSMLTQLNLWVDTHPADQRLAGALTLRCRTRVQMNIDLRLAHKDCERALDRANEMKTRLSSMFTSPGFGEIYESLALVDLRTGENDKSILDFTRALKSDDKRAWSLYGRGVAEMRLHQTKEGRADIDRAIAVAPHIADEFTAIGIRPPE